MKIKEHLLLISEQQQQIINQLANLKNGFEVQLGIGKGNRKITEAKIAAQLIAARFSEGVRISNWHIDDTNGAVQIAKQICDKAGLYD
jgi:hypothetical protein